MQNLSNFILALSALIGSITTLYQVIVKNKHDAPYSEDDVDKSIDATKKKIKQLQKKLKKEEDHKK